METTPPIENDSLESIATALLYEGFMLYPYRRSALKNRQRWNFGVLFPPHYCEQKQSGETSTMQTECLLEAGEQTVVSVQIRFLQLRGDDAVERQIAVESLSMGKLLQVPTQLPFSFGNLDGVLEISSVLVDARNCKLTVRVLNRSCFAGVTRNEALGVALISTHLLLTAENGAFHSLIDAPAELAAKAQCRNIGLWPVLAGKEGSRDRMLAAPIILYDYPKIAAQSQGDMFDGTEIDEILNLRIQTLSDEEKIELQRNPRTAALLEQAEQLEEVQFANLHGTFQRSEVAKTRVKAGDRVVLRPKRRSDILDLALTGRSATVSSVEIDFEDKVHVCVTVDDDPGKDLGLEGKPGHRFFFGQDEVELL
jgi:hypothetical protein